MSVILSGVLTPFLSLGQDASIDEQIEAYMEPVTNSIMDVIFVTVPVVKLVILNFSSVNKIRLAEDLLIPLL